METQQAQRFDIDELASRASEIIERLKTGPWPSHVIELEKTRCPLAAYAAGLAARKTAWAGLGPRVCCAGSLRYSTPVGACYAVCCRRRLGYALLISLVGGCGSGRLVGVGQPARGALRRPPHVLNLGRPRRRMAAALLSGEFQWFKVYGGWRTPSQTLSRRHRDGHSRAVGCNVSGYYTAAATLRPVVGWLYALGMYLGAKLGLMYKLA